MSRCSFDQLGALFSEENHLRLSALIRGWLLSCSRPFVCIRSLGKVSHEVLDWPSFWRLRDLGRISQIQEPN
jgi:hypothetical protein